MTRIKHVVREVARATVSGRLLAACGPASSTVPPRIVAAGVEPHGPTGASGGGLVGIHSVALSACGITGPPDG